MIALFDNFATVDDQHLIGITDGAQAMRNHKARAPFHQAQQRTLDAHFGAGVDTARRLVENQNPRISQNRTRNRQ